MLLATSEAEPADIVTALAVSGADSTATTTLPLGCQRPRLVFEIVREILRLVENVMDGPRCLMESASISRMWAAEAKGLIWERGSGKRVKRLKISMADFAWRDETLSEFNAFMAELVGLQILQLLGPADTRFGRACLLHSPPLEALRCAVIRTVRAPWLVDGDPGLAAVGRGFARLRGHTLFRDDGGRLTALLASKGSGLRVLDLNEAHKHIVSGSDSTVRTLDVVADIASHAPKLEAIGLSWTGGLSCIQQTDHGNCPRLRRVVLLDQSDTLYRRFTHAKRFISLPPQSRALLDRLGIDVSFTDLIVTAGRLALNSCDNGLMDPEAIEPTSGVVTSTDSKMGLFADITGSGGNRYKDENVEGV
ncbi:hypothetical protein BDK51DRAFT_50973 [Blyttiomyces helicus]|uniref:Uncharacterized protein n=1 Tax=Blyttiomyces helicus TaxID=388810 RepID=A0A4P9W189_9FUNG|nr:hypothetical protein BDK51DRAFT_50973 [Blyttiomyces helicus]|eukprot:RKO83826.1 hypothetical protein BDK51DRAFT_50973 [Blyttiomyces helicus]